MNSKTKKVLKIVLPILLAVIIFFIGFLTGNGFLDKDTRALRDILDKYKRYYLYEDENVLDIINDAIFDDYSKYFTKEEYNEIIRSAKGYNSGIGIKIEKETNRITSVIYNSPSEYAGVKSGGIITGLSINGTPYTNVSNGLKLLKNGDRVKLTIDYNGTIEEYDITKREYIQSYVRYFDSSGEYGFRGESIAYEKISDITSIVDEKVGYIKYDSFSGKQDGLQGSIGQLKKVLGVFRNSNKEHLIFDLRGNSGGYMSILEGVASLIVPAKKGENYIISRAIDKYDNVEIIKSKKSTFEDYNISKITILADSGTASASEVLIGAILDYSYTYSNCEIKMLISDENKNNLATYGKGIMQTTYQNFDGSAVRVTTAKLYSPLTNKSIHGVGFTSEYDSKISVCKESEILSVAQG